MRFIKLILTMVSLTGLFMLGLGACDRELRETSSWCTDNENAPTGEGIYQGIDVSSYQKKVDWSAANSAGVYFSYVKATESNHHVDSEFKRNWQILKETGIARGAYHFFKPEVDAMAQAKHFIATVKLETGDLPPVLDIEVSDGVAAADIDKDILIWLKAVEAAYGVKPVIYSDPAFINQYLSKGFESYPLWLARYTHKVPKAPAEWKDWNFWQCSQSGTVAGVKTKVDKTIYRGSESHWQTLLYRGKNN